MTTEKRRPTLTICQGLPGSGKTTWALEQVEQARQAKASAFGSGLGGEPVGFKALVRVNRDEIRRRFEQTGWVWSRENERIIVSERDRLIKFALEHWLDVISDDTNLSTKTVRDLHELARKHDAIVLFKSFLDVPIETCIARDSTRTGKARVGEQVIRRMAEEHHIRAGSTSAESPVLTIKGKPLTFEKETYKKLVAPPSAIICDLDGTLAYRHPGRGPYDFSTCDQDVICEPVRLVLEVFYRFMDYRIVYVTGREEQFRRQTDAFRMKHHCPPGPLFMRENADFRKDFLIKREIYFREIHEKYTVRFVLDDRDQVVAMWRALGLKCFQVAPGAF